jgi:hypothetical protein
MNARSANLRLAELSQALDRLEEALTIPETAPLAIDGTIKRFELVFELCWKTMNALIELNTPSATANSARSAIKAAYAPAGSATKPHGSICSTCATRRLIPTANLWRKTSTAASACAHQ